MIDPEKRKAIWQFYQDGAGINKLAAMTGIDKKTIRRIVELKGETPQRTSKNKIIVDEDLLRDTFNKCNGWVQRVHEILTEEKGIAIGYSTLTSLVREMGLRKKDKERSHQVPDVPGEEFQHDTSPYVVKIGTKKIRVQASSIYYRYSKVRYLKFYRSFTKFHLKCFFYEALIYFGYVPKICIIDNTSLVRHHGTGANMVPHTDMMAFAKMFNFKWKAHKIGHSDRKAGVEKNFFTIISNFFAGREFESFEDLNKQVFDWCQRRAQKPTTKKKIIPCDAFEYEKTYMEKVSPSVLRPYLIHQRDVDQYGFISFDGNFYWTPLGTHGTVNVLEYSDSIVIYQQRKKIITYALPPHGSKQAQYTPNGMKIEYRPKKKTVKTSMEEARLKELGEEISEYLSCGLKEQGSVQKKQQFIRGLYNLYRKMTPSLFNEAISRALKYRAYDLRVIERICSIIIQNENCELPAVNVEGDFEMRESYLEGKFSCNPDLNQYGVMDEKT